eukprot:scaffold748_cov251-Pinguiococcus_pyrenoidosus.AAC.61
MLTATACMKDSDLAQFHGLEGDPSWLLLIRIRRVVVPKLRHVAVAPGVQLPFVRDEEVVVISRRYGPGHDFLRHLDQDRTRLEVSWLRLAVQNP